MRCVRVGLVLVWFWFVVCLGMDGWMDGLGFGMDVVVVVVVGGWGIAVRQTDRQKTENRKQNAETSENAGGGFFSALFWLAGWLAGWLGEGNTSTGGGRGRGRGLKLPGPQPVFFCLRVGLVWFGLVWPHGLSSPRWTGLWTGLDWWTW